MERDKTGSPDNKSSVNINYEAYITATNEYRLAKLKYYREVLRKNDQELINSLNKIPDDWGKYETGSFKKIVIESDVKKRLSDIKQKKSWELKYESLFLSHIVTVEESLIDCLSFNNISDEKLSESIESLNCIMVEIGSQTFNIKHLLMSLAKRSVSDLYYLMSAYYQFFKKKSFDIDTNFYEFCEDILVLFNDHKRVSGTLTLIKDIMDMINPYFSATAFSAGWRLDEFAMKQFADKNDAEKKQMANNMKKAVQLLHSLRMKMKRARDFLSYYYSPRDGKMYRYNFIVESLTRKLDEGKITSHDFDSFNNIKTSFLKMLLEFERLGIEEFGTENFNYEHLLDCLFKTGKVLEFIHLRAMMYEELNSIRNTILRKAEKELIDMRETRKRFGQFAT